MRRWTAIAGGLGVTAVAVLAVLAASRLGGGSGGPLAGQSLPQLAGEPLPAGTPVPSTVPPPLEGDNLDASIAVGIGDTASATRGQTAFTGGSAAGPATGGTGVGPVSPPLPQVAERKIVRNATIGLSVEAVGRAVQEVENIAVAAGGFVSASNVFIEEPPQPLSTPEGQAPPTDSRPPERTQTASVTIRVPASAYATVVSQLRGIAKEVVSESSQASDVTEEYADLSARLRNLEATEARYLELLAQAKTIPDILTMQDRLNGVRLEIEQTQGRINLLNNLTDLATITVQLRPYLAVEEQPSEPGWAQEVAEGAWETSQDVMQALATVGIVGGVVLAWLAVPGLAIAIGWRLLGPRRERKGEA